MQNDKRLSELERQVTQLKQEKEALLGYGAQLETIVQSQEQKLKTAGANQEVLERSRKAEIFKLSELVKQSEQQLREKTRTVETLEAQLQATQTTLLEKDGKLQTSTEDRAKLQQKFNELQKAFALGLEHRAELISRSKEQATTHFQKKDALKTLEFELQARERTIQDLEEATTAKNQLITTLTEETRKLANALSKSQADHQEQLSFAQSGMAGLHAQIADLKKTISELEKRPNYEQQCQVNTALLMATQAKVSWQEKFELANQQVTELTNVLNALTQKTSQKDRIIEKVDSLFNNSLTVGQFATLERALEKAEERTAEAEKTLASQTKTLELKELGIKNLQGQVLALKGELAILKANAPSASAPERSSLSQQSFRDLQKLVTEHLHKIRQGEAEIQRLQAELAKSLLAEKKLEAINNSQAVTIGHLEQKLTALEVERSNLRGQLKHCQDSFTAVSEARDEAAKTFRKKLKKQQAKHEKLKRKLQKRSQQKILVVQLHLSEEQSEPPEMDFRELYPSFRDQL